MRLLSIALCLCLTTALPAKTPELAKRTEEKHYSLRLPEGWHTGSNDNGLFYAVSPPSNPSDIFTENFTVYAEDIPSDVTLDQYFSQALDGLKEVFPDVEIKDQGDAEIDGTPAKWLHYTITVGGRSFEFLQYCAFQGGKSYILTGAADSEEFDTYRPIFQQILKSFRFTNENETS